MFCVYYVSMASVVTTFSDVTSNLWTVVFKTAVVPLL